MKDSISKDFIFDESGKVLKKYNGIGGEVEIPEGVISIEAFAFRGCSGLTKVTIPRSIRNIGIEAFRCCIGLTEVVWNATNCAPVSDYFPIFTGCSNLTSVTFGENVETIPAYAFYRCYSLASLIIGNRVTNIGERAFCGCNGLRSIILPDGVMSVGDEAFCGSCPTSINIGKSVESIGKDAFNGCCILLTSLTVAAGNPKYHSDGNCLIQTAEKTLILGCKNSVIPTDGSVTRIGDYAFRNCKLTSIDIPYGVKSIGDGVFSGCYELTSITIPDSVKNIGECVCAYCDHITSITIPAGVTTICDLLRIPDDSDDSEEED